VEINKEIGLAGGKYCPNILKYKIGLQDSSKKPAAGKAVHIHVI